MKPARSRKYLDWIRTLPCLCCGAKAEAAHTGSHGMAQKASDFSAVPLCWWHHREGGCAIHKGVRAFVAFWQLDLALVVETLNRWYESDSDRQYAAEMLDAWMKQAGVYGRSEPQPHFGATSSVCYSD